MNETSNLSEQNWVMKQDLTEDLVFLCACAVNGVVVDKERIEKIDLSELYKTAERHMLTAVVAYALELANVFDDTFELARVKAIRKMAIMDTEQSEILKHLETAGIWYMPLKGAILKDFYPVYGIRQMSDRDILVDSTRMEDIRVIMEDLGFCTKEFGKHHHDSYIKPPVCNFEMHHQLFSPIQGKRISRYYTDIKTRLVKDEANEYGWHFIPEDFYLHMVTHEYKHYSENGTGLRSLLDIYVFLKSVKLKYDYITNETEKLGISEFEKANRVLATRLFGGETLKETEKRMLSRFAVSGTYGSSENYANNQLATKGRLKFFLSRLILPYPIMQRAYPVLYKMPLLYPLCWLHRIVSACVLRSETVKHQLGALFTWKDE